MKLKTKKKKNSRSFIHGSDLCRNAIWFYCIPTSFRSLDGMSVGNRSTQLFQWETQQNVLVPPAVYPCFYIQIFIVIVATLREWTSCCSWWDHNLVVQRVVAIVTTKFEHQFHILWSRKLHFVLKQGVLKHIQTHTHTHTEFCIHRPVLLNNAPNKAESSRKG